MLKNNKGFTVIELIMSFIFTSILALSLFSAIVLYKSKQVDARIEADLIAFKSQITIDVQQDIQVKGLKNIVNCPPNQEEISRGEKIHPGCVVISFNDNTSKTFSLMRETREDTIENKDGTESKFPYYVPYIIYGDIRYDIPDSTNVYIDDDYILQTTTTFDGRDYGINVYKINFNLRHNDLDTLINIAIVASGSDAVSSLDGPYKKYKIGDRVRVNLSSYTSQDNYYGPTTAYFNVIKNSSKYDRTVTLLYSDDTLLKYNPNFSLFSLYSEKYNTMSDSANVYEGSAIKEVIDTYKAKWNYVDDVRLLTLEDISKFAIFSPDPFFTNPRDSYFAYINVGNISFWNQIIDCDCWTMSPVKLTNGDKGKKVWVFNDQTLQSEYVDQGHTLKPVITVKKDYILN